jgi:hypothetical protein
VIKNLSYISLLLLVLIIFRSFLTFDLISSGDFFSIKDVSSVPYIWDWSFAIGGLGGVTLGFSWLHFVVTLPTILFRLIGLNWEIIQKIAYIYPLIFLLIFSPVMFFKKIFPKNNFYLISAIIFAFNTYVLMLIGGGQIYLALAYALFPIILYLFIKQLRLIKIDRSKKLKYAVFTGLAFGVESMIDLRIAYVIIVALIIYLLLIINFRKLSRDTFKNKILIIFNTFFYLLIIPLGITALIHAFWLIPLAIIRQNPLSNLGLIYSSSSAVKFFSFARIENTISLLHPNWPENIFGKVYFMRPEFLLLPILAFASLLFINKVKNLQEKKYVLFFTLLGIIGIFLAKGANDPFDGVYIWMFEHIPGFMMFRDATKFYVLVALSYSILIPFTVLKVYEYLKSKNLSKNKLINLQNLFLGTVIIYLLVLIRPAILGQLNGTFKPTSIPDGYLKFEKYITSQNKFFRTFWVPQFQRFGFYSNAHPVISGKDFYNVTSAEEVVKELKNKNTEKKLQEMAVKYVIVPYDSKGEIFLKDRKYDEKAYLKTITEVSKIDWLKRVEGFDKIAVFEVLNPKGHFYIDTEIGLNNGSVSYKYINPTEYKVTVKNVIRRDVLVFSESFDSKWIIKNEVDINSQRHNKLFNSFKLPKDGTYNLTVYYEPQKWVNIGLTVSTLSLIIVVFTLIVITLKEKFKNKF